MKKMGFTKSKWTAFLGKSLLLPLFALCFVSLQTAMAQVVIPNTQRVGADTCETVVLETCGGTVDDGDLRWTDDGENDGNYADPLNDARTDTIEFCAKDKWHRVRVVFTDFDLYDADGDGEVDPEDDYMNVYQGSKAEVRTSAQAIGYILDGNGDFIWDAALAPSASNPYRTDGGEDATAPATSTPGVGFRRTGPTPLAIPAAGTGTGTGVAKAFGGWVDAACSPTANPTGCLTFILRTNGDNKKGAGWDAWVDCQARDVEIKVSGVRDYRLQCGQIYADVLLPAATIEACDETLIHDDAEHIVRVLDNHGKKIFEKHTVSTPIDVRAVGIGQYAAEYILKGDTTKRKLVPFSVQAPALVGNDNIIVPLGAACMSEITPDMVLENPCDPISGVLEYNVSITIPGAHGFKSKTVGGIVTAQDIADAGQKVCDVTATVTVTRTYYPNNVKPSTVQIFNGEVKASTSTQVSFSDDERPWVDFASAPDTLIGCDAENVAKFLSVRAVDNCSDATLSDPRFSFAEEGPCWDAAGQPDTTILTVSYTATDGCGNQGFGSHRIVMIRPDLTDAQFLAKARDVQVDCKETGVAPVPGVKVGPWNNGALNPKTTDTVYLSTEEYICGYILTAEEEEIPATDCGEKKYVYYSVLDWCHQTTGIRAIDTVFIENVDEEQPYLVDTTATRQFFRTSTTNSSVGFTAKRIATDASVSLAHFECTYDANKLPKPAAIDNCDDNVTVSLSGTAHWVDENGILRETVSSSSLECGTYYLKWTASDICHEQDIVDVAYQLITVVDDTKPSAACVDQLNVSVPNEWGARISVEDIDAGSYDACGIKSMLIRIKGSGDAWTETIDIGCEYVHKDLQVEMQVLDKKGNENICWLDVLVEDKINPICEPLEDKEVYCDDYHDGELGASTDADEDLEMESSEWVALEGDLLAFYNAHFGDPATLKVCQDNLNADECGDLRYEQQYQLIKWPCGEAKAKRRYRARDWSDLYSGWVEQSITVKSKQDWKITFPADWEGSCGDMAPAESIVVENGACDLLGFEVTEKQFDIPGDACFKIERTYHVINWCKYVAGDEPVELARVEGDHGYSEGLMVTSEGNEDKGYWTYIQVLKVHDDEAPVVTITNPEPCINGIEFDAIPYGEEDVTPGASPFECDEPKTWTAVATDCSSNISWVGKLYNAETGALVKEVETNEITHIVSNKDSYFAEFWAYDNCGNSGGEKGDPVKFWDCKKPTPYVLNGVAVELMQTGMIQVWANDLNQNSFDNCTDQSKLDMRIWADFLGDAPSDLEGVQALGKVITFDCDRVGTNVVYIYVIDEEGNWDFAQTYVIVQDNMNACDGDPVGGGMVAGTIVNPQGENVESVEVSIAGAAQQTITTGADGSFMFNMATGENYTVTPTKDINPLNGVSTFDLVLISKHILGITQFDSPYKYIAADVNKSGSITAFDMVQLRQLILNITTEFPGNDSWRFVDASHEFTTANAAAENFSEFYTINTLAGDMENVDFVGVKVGDVNGNAKANSLLGAETRSTNGALTLTAADRFVEAGETVTVAFTAPEIANAQGYQFTLNFAGQDAKIGEGVAKATNFNTQLAQRGVIATSWNGEATANDVLFSMTFNATASGLLSELVSVSSDITTAEAYNTDGDLLDVNLEFAAVAAAGFELGQNSPNPFNGETLIGFNLPIAGSATLTVMDAQGKVLKAITADYAKGANQVSLNANELGATGVLYYQLESADNVATKKMIIIE